MKLPLLEVYTEPILEPEMLGWKTAIAMGDLNISVAHLQPRAEWQTDFCHSIAHHAAWALSCYSLPTRPPLRFLKRHGRHYQAWEADNERRNSIATQLAPVIEEKLAH